jgi:cold shock CspA family protein
MTIEAVIDFYNQSRGYGFANEIRNGQIVRYFVHASQIISGTPKVGAKCHFDFIQTMKGLQAVNIIIDNGSAQ